MEALEIGRSFAKGATYIFGGRVISYGLGLIGNVLIARLLAIEYGSSEPLGWLLVLSFIPALTTLLGDFGVSYGVMNRCAKLVKEGNYEESSKYVWTMTFYTLILWSFYAIITLFIGEWLALNLYSKPEIIPFIHLVAIGIVASVLYHNIAQTVSLILDKTWIFSLMMLIYSATQASLVPLALITGFKFYGVAFVYFILMPLLSSIPGLTILFKYFKIKKPDLTKLKEMIKFGFPMAASNYVAMPVARIYEALISRFARSIELGNFYVAQRLNALAGIFLYPIDTLMFVNYSKLNKSEDLNIAANFTIKIIAYFIAPISMFTLFFSKQLITVLFGRYYSEGWIYLSLIALSWLVYCVGENVLYRLLASQGNTKEVFKLSTISIFIGLALYLVLIPMFSIIGALISSIIASWPSYFLALRYVKNKLNVKIRFNEIIKILLASVLSVIPSFMLWLSLSSISRAGVVQYYALLSSCILISFSIYVLTTKRMNIIRDSEMDFIERSLKQIPFAGNLISLVLGFYKKL